MEKFRAQSGAGRRSPCAGAVRAHLGPAPLGRTRAAAEPPEPEPGCSVALWGPGGSLGASGGPFPWHGDERSFRRAARAPGRSVRGRRTSGALSKIAAECGAGRAGSGRGRGCAWAAQARGRQAGT